MNEIQLRMYRKRWLRDRGMKEHHVQRDERGDFVTVKVFKKNHIEADSIEYFPASLQEPYYREMMEERDLIDLQKSKGKDI